MASRQTNGKTSLSSSQNQLPSPQPTVGSELTGPSAPLKASEQLPHTIYLKKLMGKHTNRVDQVQSFTRSKQQQFHEEIINGRYSIRDRDWSAEQDKPKTSRVDVHKNATEMVHARKQLEDELELIEGEIKDNQEKGNREMDEEQRTAFLRKMEKERKDLLRRKEENAKFREERRIEEQRKAKELLEKQQNEKKQKKQQEIAERLKALEDAKKRKEEEYKSQSLILKEKMKEKTMVDRIEEHYNLTQNESLEERKKRLAEIRMIHKPIDRKELDAHTEKFQQLHSERLAALAATAEKGTDRVDVAFYKSIFYKRVKEQQKIFLDKKNEEELGKLRENRDKLKRFSQHIRENYKPTIDERKVELLKYRNVNRSMSKTEHESAQKIGLRYLQFSKMQVDHQKLLVSGEQEEEEEEKPKKLDYLSELRSKNKNRASQSAHELLNKLDKVSISKQDKMKRILEFTDKIEKTAKRKEELHKISSNLVDDELDALYLEAIEAKLGLLEDY